MKKNGFTLIELLAVIIILGVIMLIAIPSVTKYINDSRKETYIDTAKQIVKGTIPMVNGGELDVYDTNTTYYIPASCIPTENSMSSPFGEFEQAYVIVGYTGEGYVYYWASVDKAHQGIEMKEYDKLSKSDVKSNVDSIDTTIGIGSRNDIKILDEENCQSFVEGSSSSNNPIVYPEGKTKDTVEIGDLVTIGTEKFIVVKHEGTDLVLLAHYNLNVNHLKPGATEGIQNSEVRGYFGNDSLTYGNLQFSATSYWQGKVGDGLEYPGSYGNDNTLPYVYDSNSNLYPYVNAYKDYLEGLGATIKEARLLKVTEQNLLNSNGKGDIVLLTSFWLGNANSDDCLHNVRATGGSVCNGPSYGAYYGVRPVIVI